MNKLVIFGVGLIGGSVALAMKRAHAVTQVVGIGRSGDNLQAALDLKVIDVAENRHAQALHNADLILLAAPVGQTAPILSAIAPHLQAHTVITDVGSTKSDVVEHARSILGQNIDRFVPGHPIAGAEKAGVTAATADLFDGKNVVLTPNETTSPQALNKVRELWQQAGANVSEMSASQHDSIFASVSHLPHLLAFGLVEMIAARPNAQQLFDFAASGFRDFTRIAGSSPEMWRDISLANRTALLAELDDYQQVLVTLRQLIQSRDSKKLQALYERASQARNAWAYQKTLAR